MKHTIHPPGTLTDLFGNIATGNSFCKGFFTIEDGCIDFQIKPAPFPSEQPTMSLDTPDSSTNNLSDAQSQVPTLVPSFYLTKKTSSTPSPSYQPTLSSDPSVSPTNNPFSTPSHQPTLSTIPSALPSTSSPSQQPTKQVPTTSPTIKIHDGNYITPGYFNYDPDDLMFGPGDPYKKGYFRNPWTKIVDPPNIEYWAPFKNELDTNLHTNFCGNNQNQSPVDLCPNKASGVCMEAHQIRYKVSE